MERLYNEYGALNERGRSIAEAVRAMTYRWLQERSIGVDVNDLELAVMSEVTCSMAEIRLQRANALRLHLRLNDINVDGVESDAK
jgi:hypothetical protein